MNTSKDIAAMGAVDLDITLSAQQDAVEPVAHTNQPAPNAVIVSGYSGDPDTKGTLLVKVLDLTSCKVGDYLYTAPRLAAQQEAQEPVKLSDEQIKAHGDKASRMMARDLTRFDAACEVIKYLREQGAPYYYMHRMCIVLFGNDEGTEAARAPDTDPQPSPASQRDALDVARLDWMDADGGRCVFHFGKTWYSRLDYGQPYRKYDNLRGAIDAACLTQASKK